MCIENGNIHRIGDSIDIKSKSKLLSLVLRHRPEEIGIDLDKYGWADVEGVLNGIKCTMAELEEIVSTDDKNRYSFNEDKSKIRANQGHSIAVDLGLEETIPPDELYHGTSERFIRSIMENGINKQSRQYVHLSSELETALNVGRRHGNPKVILVNAERMVRCGFKFYLSKNGVWLTDYVPKEFLSKL